MSGLDLLLAPKQMRPIRNRSEVNEADVEVEFGGKNKVNSTHLLTFGCFPPQRKLTRSHDLLTDHQ